MLEMAGSYMNSKWPENFNNSINILINLVFTTWSYTPLKIQSFPITGVFMAASICLDIDFIL